MHGHGAPCSQQRQRFAIKLSEHVLWAIVHRGPQTIELYTGFVRTLEYTEPSCTRGQTMIVVEYNARPIPNV